MIQHFVVYTIPIGKGRPKFVRATGRAYTPPKTAAYEELIRNAYLDARQQHDEWGILSGRIRVIIECGMPIPKSTSKKKRAEMLRGDIPHTKKPDVDNMAKAVLDALNGEAYTDDSYIEELLVKKHYAENPSVEVWLYGEKGDSDESGSSDWETDERSRTESKH